MPLSNRIIVLLPKSSIRRNKHLSVHHYDFLLQPKKLICKKMRVVFIVWHFRSWNSENYVNLLLSIFNPLTLSLNYCFIFSAEKYALLIRTPEGVNIWKILNWTRLDYNDISLPQREIMKEKQMLLDISLTYCNMHKHRCSKISSLPNPFKPILADMETDIQPDGRKCWTMLLVIYGSWNVKIKN